MNRTFMDTGGKSKSSLPAEDPKNPMEKPTSFRALGVADSTQYGTARPYEMDASYYNSKHGVVSKETPGITGTRQYINNAGREMVDSDFLGTMSEKPVIGKNYDNFVQNLISHPALEKYLPDNSQKPSDFLGTNSYNFSGGKGGDMYDAGDKVYALRQKAAQRQQQGQAYYTPAGNIPGTYQYQGPAPYKPATMMGIAAKRDGGNIGWGDGMGYDHSTFFPFSRGGVIPMFSKGGKIHIKPSHKGRFTAFKKRTGETTAQAKNSSSPAVRKMAVFASNAAHWSKKKNGGKMSKFSKAAC